MQNLKLKELRRELQARGITIEQGMKKDQLQEELDDVLRGVIRVPALLLTDPTESILTLGIERYEVVASEPLHDLKGHIINIITELPSIITPGSEAAIKCTHLIECCLSKEKKSGADLRRVVIQIFFLLKDMDVPPKVLLLPTIIKVGEISYSLDSARSPRRLLQLYNCCWVHNMELCRDLPGKPKKISESKMFGHYLHALTAHSPTQYELASLRSLNTENQERLFGQARLMIAECCTNHHPDNVIPQVIIVTTYLSCSQFGVVGREGGKVGE